MHKFFQVFFDAFVGDVWPVERQITNDGQAGRGGRKSRGFLKKYFVEHICKTFLEAERAHGIETITGVIM